MFGKQASQKLKWQWYILLIVCISLTASEPKCPCTLHSPFLFQVTGRLPAATNPLDPYKAREHSERGQSPMFLGPTVESAQWTCLPWSEWVCGLFLSRKPVLRHYVPISTPADGKQQPFSWWGIGCEISHSFCTNTSVNMRWAFLLLPSSAFEIFWFPPLPFTPALPIIPRSDDSHNFLRTICHLKRKIAFDISSLWRTTIIKKLQM